MLYENVNLEKNKYAVEILVTCALLIKIFCRPTHSCETISLFEWKNCTRPIYQSQYINIYNLMLWISKKMYEAV